MSETIHASKASAPKPFVLGVGGVIGSGKSVVMKLLSTMGMPTYDCDCAAKCLYHHPDVRQEISDLLGEDPIGKDDTLKKRLILTALETPVLKDRLERIIHSSVIHDIERWLSQQDGPVALESAILFSSSVAEICDFTVSVEAPAEIRRERVARRDGDRAGSRFEQIEQLQERERQLLKRANATLINDDVHSVIRQVECLLTGLSIV